MVLLNNISKKIIALIEDTFIETILDKLTDLRYKFLSVKYGIKNIWNWRKIIYRDRWYDYSFLLSIMKFKLETMRDSWDDSHYVGSEYDKVELTLLIDLFSKLEEADNTHFNSFKEESEYREKIYNEIGTRLFTKVSTHRIDKEFDNGELYNTSIGIEKFWD